MRKPGNEKMISRLVLDWPRRWRDKYPDQNLIGKLNELNTSKAHEEYYTNTIDFVKHSEAHADWYKKYTEREE